MRMDSYVYRLIQARSNAEAVAAYLAFLSTARAWNRVGCSPPPHLVQAVGVRRCSDRGGRWHGRHG